MRSGLGKAMKHQLGYDERLVLQSPTLESNPIRWDAGDATRWQRQFGLFPSELITTLCNEDADLRSKAEAVEELKLIIEDPQNDISDVVPHIGRLLEFLSKLIGAGCYKVSSPALEVVASLVHRLPPTTLLANLQKLMSLLAHNIGDSSIFTRRTVTETIVKLMKVSSPSTVLDALSSTGLVHRDARIRQETLNIIIIALLLFPSSAFDLVKLTQNVSVTLVDGRRPVRQAALECIAVLAQTFGPGQRHVLTSIVDQVESQIDGAGIKEAVNARLSNRQLPKQNLDGLVEYAAYTGRSHAGAITADIAWVLSASAGHSSSAKSTVHRSSEMSLSDNRFGQSAPCSPATTPDGERGDFSARLRRSTRRSMLRFPWDIKGQQTKTNSVVPISSSGDQTNQMKSPTSPEYIDSLPSSNDVTRRDTPSSSNDVTQSNWGVYHHDNVDSACGENTSSSGADRRLCKSATKKKVDKMFAQLESDKKAQFTASKVDDKVPPRAEKNNKKKTPNFKPDKDAGKSAFSAWTVDINSADIDMDEFPHLKSATGVTDQLIRRPPMQTKGREKRRYSNGETGSSHGLLKGTVSSANSIPELNSQPSVIGTSLFEQSARRDSTAKPPVGLNTQANSANKGDPSARRNSTSKPPVGISTHAKSASNFNPSTRRNSTVKPPSGLAIQSNSASNGIVFNDGMSICGTAATMADEISYISSQPPPRRRPKQMQVEDKSVPHTVESRKNSTPELAFETKLPPSSLPPQEKQLPMHQQPQDFMRNEEVDSTYCDLTNGLDASEHINVDTQFPIQRRKHSIGSDKKRRQSNEVIQQDNAMNATGLITRPHSHIVVSSSAADSSDAMMRKPPRQYGKPRQQSAPPVTQVNEDEQQWDGNDLTKSIPFRDPVAAVTKSLRQISAHDEEWEKKCEGLNGIRRLSFHHSDVLCAQLHSISLAVLAEVKNLRSMVVILALKCTADMYRSLRRDMANELDVTVQTVLIKTADTNNFIRDEAFKTLIAVIESIQPPKVLVVLITSGASHRHVVVRAATARLICHLAELLGADEVLSGSKDITDRILSTCSQFVLDSSPDVRHCGQQIFHALIPHKDFDFMLSRYVSASVLSSVQEKIETMKKRGLSNPPSEIRKSALERKGSGRAVTMTRKGSGRAFSKASSGADVAGGDGGSDGASGSSSAPASAVNSRRRHHVTLTAQLTVDVGVQEELSIMIACLKASDFRERINGLNRLKDIAANSPRVITANTTQIFDQLVPCLKDPNSKVNLMALGVLGDIVPCVAPSFSNVVNLTVTTVAVNLASSKPEIGEAASRALDSLVEHIDPSMLLPSFSSLAQTGNSRYKVLMIERVTSLVPKLFIRRSNQAALLHILPLIWSLLGTTGPRAPSATKSGTGLSMATANLVRTLYSHIGNDLLDAATANSKVSPLARSALRNMVDSGA